MRDASLAAYQEPRIAMDRVVAQYAPLVKRIAHHLLGRLPNSVQLDDLIQSGMIGLLEAAQKYDASKGASFETYAGIRIRGSMLDEMRRGDWAPRSVHRNSRRVAAAIRAVELRKANEASDQEIAAELGVSLEEYFAMLADAAGRKLFSFDELPVDDNGDSMAFAYPESSPGPYEHVQNSVFQARLVEAIKNLPEREQLVLSLYYDDELNLKEIGEVLGVSESRVSQIHTQATLRLRARLQDWNGGT
jgi:RNA polymerase sigma factor for flagellar operon FliA